MHRCTCTKTDTFFFQYQTCGIFNNECLELFFHSARKKHKIINVSVFCFHSSTDVHVMCNFFLCRDDEETTNRHRPHILRTSEYCWCDRVAMNAFNEVSQLAFNLKLEASKVCFTLS